jgi:hypothetical protein
MQRIANCGVHVLNVIQIETGDARDPSRLGNPGAHGLEVDGVHELIGGSPTLAALPSGSGKDLGEDIEWVAFCPVAPQQPHRDKIVDLSACLRFLMGRRNIHQAGQAQVPAAKEADKAFKTDLPDEILDGCLAQEELDVLVEHQSLGEQSDIDAIVSRGGAEDD